MLCVGLLALGIGLATTMFTPEMQAKQDSIDARLKATFSSEGRRQLDEDGPCIARTVK